MDLGPACLWDSEPFPGLIVFCLDTAFVRNNAFLWLTNVSRQLQLVSWHFGFCVGLGVCAHALACLLACMLSLAHSFKWLALGQIAEEFAQLCRDLGRAKVPMPVMLLISTLRKCHCRACPNLTESRECFFLSIQWHQDLDFRVCLNTQVALVYLKCTWLSWHKLLRGNS